VIRRVLAAAFVAVLLLVVGAGLRVVRAQGRGSAVDPAVAARVATAPALTIEQVNRWESELSNWGKWGPDGVTYGIHDSTNSHLDALCHYALPRDGRNVVFNNHPQNLDKEGCHQNGIDRMGPGVVSRAILVDMPLLKKVPYLEPGTPILV